MAELLPGAPVAERLTQDLKARSDALRQRGVIPTLAIIRVGRDPGGLAYEKGAASRCAKCGIDLRRIALDDTASLPEVIRAVNDDPAIHGCLLLRPLADKAAEEAAGRPGLITADFLRPGQTVLDVGVHPGPDGTLCGDVAPEAAGLDLALTPVPGGVGSVTSAVLCTHTIQAAATTRL